MSDEQRKVRKFYKEFLSWKAENIGVWIGTGFIEVLFAVMMMIPYQEMLHDPGLFVFPVLFVGKIFPIMMILQLLCAYWSFKEITIANIIYAIGMGFVLPVLGNLPGAVIGK